MIQKSATNAQSRAQDSWIDQNATGTNHGGSTTLQVQSYKNGGTSENQRALVQFDLSALNSSGIKSATLTMFMTMAPSASRTYGAYRVTSRWLESAVTWASRLTGFAWGAAGGDINGTATGTTTTGTTNNTSLSWTITADVQQWFGSTSPIANYGTVIRDQTEDSGTQYIAMFAAIENATQANRPSLTINFVQNVQGLASTAGNAQVVLNWSYPATIGTVLSPTVGVLILRESGGSIPSTTVPADGTAYTACSSTISGATVVFSSNTMPTTFNDSATGNNPGCPPTNGTLYAYKVFTMDAANNYSESGANSSFVPLTAAAPNTTAGTQLSVDWNAATNSTTLTAPGLNPGVVVGIATSSNITYGVNPSNGDPIFTPVAVDGAITGRPPVLPSSITTIGANVIYTADQNGFVYAINSSNGNILWSTNPTGAEANTFTSGPAVLVKSFAASYTGTHDLVVLGTRNSGTTTGNSIWALDGNTGATVWSLTGSANGNPAMDIVAATPYVDYKNNAIWATSNSAGGTAQPSLWKISPNGSGAITSLATANLGNISNPAFVTVAGETLLVGTDGGTLYAINTSTAATRASYATGDTMVVGYPVVLNYSSPYTVIFSGATAVHAVIFNSTTNTFTTTGAGTWSTTFADGCTPSGPAGYPGLAYVYVGCSDGAIYEVNVTNGTVTNTKSLRPGSTLGDVALDTTLGVLIVGSTSSRIYAIAYPF